MRCKECGTVLSVDISAALAIPDLRWPTAPELEFLAREAAKHERIVEIGSYVGRSTIAMAVNTEGLVYALDDWHGPRDVEIDDDERSRLYDTFLANIAPYRERVTPVRCDHASPPRGLKPDMVFIDGAHDYESVVRDVTFWRGEIVEGGLLCGHDAEWDDVARAVYDTLGTLAVIPNTNIWIAL